MIPAAVLDASALLAFMRDEAGAERVEEAVASGCAISAVNLAEALSKLADHGGDPAALMESLRVLGDGLAVLAVDDADAVEVARLRPQTRAAGLSLDDRACLALAGRAGAPALTTDRAWKHLDVGVEIDLIR